MYHQSIVNKFMAYDSAKMEEDEEMEVDELFIEYVEKQLKKEPIEPTEKPTEDGKDRIIDELSRKMKELEVELSYYK